MEHSMSKYGYDQYDVYIEIAASSAGTKKVYAHYSTQEGEWLDSATAFFIKLDDNTEIWKVTVSGWGLGGEYAIKYIADGQTYWDNNFGTNYTSSYNRPY